MAREVNTIMGRIISEKRGLSEAKGQEIVKQMRSSNQYQEVCSYTFPFAQHNANDLRMSGVDHATRLRVSISLFAYLCGHGSK